MTAAQLFPSLYHWADQQALTLLVGSFLLPMGLALLIALLYRGSQRDRDQRLAERLADFLVLSAVAIVVIGLLCVVIAQWAFDASLWQANLLLLASPLVYLATAVFGIRRALPLNRLASVRTLKDVGLFLLACLLVIWLLSQFRGWGILFLGGTLQLLLIGAGLYWLLRRLWLQAKGRL